MKTKYILTAAILLGSLAAFAQGIVNNGKVITVNSGTYLVINNGGYYNETDGSGNTGRIDLDGTLQLDGNFENNTSDNAEHVFINEDGTGTILFTGTAEQHILNTTPNAYISFENLTVNKTSGSVYVDAGSAATVNGDLTVTSGTFRLSSPSDGEDPSGSLITKGNVSGAGNLYVDRHFETNGRYQYISVPVGNASDDLFDNTGNSHPFNANLYSYNESYDASPDPSNTDYSNWTDATYSFYDAWVQIADNGNSIALTPATGYITYNELELDVNFGGSPSDLNNAASYSPSVSYTPNDNSNGAGDYFDGWNIIGNPYPCALDFTALSLSNINNCLYMWDGDNGNYKYFVNGGTTYDDGSNVVNGATQYIPAMQSFAIKATASSPSVVIDAADRVHNTQAMWKESKDAPDYGQTQFVKLRTEEGDFFDETIVRFLEPAKENFDNEYDAYKMFPENPPVMIYSLITNPETPVAVNTLPADDIGTMIPLGFTAAEAGTYTIEATDVVFDAGTDVKLIDAYENTETLLSPGVSYDFSFDGGEVRDRFYLFTKAGGSEIFPADDDINNAVNIWSSDDKVYISIKSEDLINANVKIFDVLGKTVTDKKITGTYNILKISQASGTYFVKVRMNNGKSKTEKVFIRK
ncbi:MAG: T9SS type A sorting domain-containing protein [Chlorobi bacterium]|nr:T9SS type A sorting domain-containing protein [Chlorobiota bacterium]